MRARALRGIPVLAAQPLWQRQQAASLWLLPRRPGAQPARVGRAQPG